MTNSDQYASRLLHNPKPKLWDFCPSLTRQYTNDVDLSSVSSVSSVHRMRIEGVDLISEEMEMEMAFRWKERGNENVKEMEREEKQKKENIKLTNTGERRREKSIDEIWKGVWI
ncbi:hypothetical protein BPAE_0215g00100 [Botrytis paeoniae]|uniref:Uncharacterized protein n=1 Tax=Botrytis paeoniae TaxID=278948 RepID=A0A4Z1FDW7_9HELO|nr:hypothetical protein BPAE_0215g00100 [Botrytis paeoniae]